MRAILSELEGVLVQTRDARRAALICALADDGVQLPARLYDDACDGLPVRSAVRSALELTDTTLDETGIELMALRAEKYFAQSAGTGVTLADGARDSFTALHGQARLAIVTRASRREAEALLGLADMTFLFECVVTSDDVPDAPKPDPAAHLTALDRLARRRRLDRREAIALEDGGAGIRAARGAGLRCLATGNVPAFRALDADGYLPSLRGATLESLDALGGHGGTG